MNNECQNQLAESRVMLAEAKTLNENSGHGAALKQAYQASEHVAVAYLAAAVGQVLPPNDANFDMFAKTIREPNRHPALLEKIRETVGKVCALREVYEPALLDETSHKDARLMMGCVTELLEVVTEIVMDLM